MIRDPGFRSAMFGTAFVGGIVLTLALVFAIFGCGSESETKLSIRSEYGLRDPYRNSDFTVIKTRQIRDAARDITDHSLWYVLVRGDSGPGLGLTLAAISHHELKNGALVKIVHVNLEQRQLGREDSFLLAEPKLN